MKKYVLVTSLAPYGSGQFKQLGYRYVVYAQKPIPGMTQLAEEAVADCPTEEAARAALRLLRDS